MFAHACCVTARVTVGVGGSGLVLWLGFIKTGKKTNNPALEYISDVLSWKSWRIEKRKPIKFISPTIGTALNPESSAFQARFSIFFFVHVGRGNVSQV